MSIGDLDNIYEALAKMGIHKSEDWIRGYDDLGENIWNPPEGEDEYEAYLAGRQSAALGGGVVVEGVQVQPMGTPETAEDMQSIEDDFQARRREAGAPPRTDDEKAE